MGQVAPGTNFSLKKLFMARNAKSRRLIQIVHYILSYFYWCDTPFRYCSLLIYLAPKQEGSLRFFVDNSCFNVVTQRESYPLSQMETALKV